MKRLTTLVLAALAGGVILATQPALAQTTLTMRPGSRPSTT